MKYRPEIDGLRAVAVLPVILFHAGFSTFSGGFVGVDVFFVISGYLITSIILKDLEAGTFSFRKFYERRARRILPALFFVIICCIPFAWMWMMPMEMQAFSTSVVAVSVFMSNILFWQQSEYFDQAAALKPLLHTWSLAVEEQFYIIFPIAMLMLWGIGRKNVLASIAVVAVVSLALSEYGSRYHPSFNFYWLPTRAWELAAGSLCAFATVGRIKNRDEVLSVAGLAAIFVAIFYYDQTTPFPSLYALLPVLGTCAIILFAQQGTLVASLLSLKPFVGIGLISYSAYLWHQPLFAFARIRSLTEPSNLLMAVLAVASVALAYFSWRYVEVPVRKHGGWPISRRQFLALSTCTASLLVAFGAAGHLTQGFAGRFLSDPEKAAFLSNFENSRPDRLYFTRYGIMEKYGDECNFRDRRRADLGLDRNEPRSSIDQSCYTRDAKKPYSVFIWGDSHAQMVRYGLLKGLSDRWQVLQVASSGCRPSTTSEQSASKFCNHSNAFAIETVERTKPDVVVLAQAEDHDPLELQMIAERLLAIGTKRVVVNGPAPQWIRDLPWIIVAHLWSSSSALSSTGLKAEVFLTDAKLRSELKTTERLKYVSLVDVFCEKDKCLNFVGSDRRSGLVSWDDEHLTPTASEFLAQQALIKAVVSFPR